MSLGRWVYPVDPDCQEVSERRKNNHSDTIPQSLLDGIQAGWELVHQRQCTRCWYYGRINPEQELPDNDLS